MNNVLCEIIEYLRENYNEEYYKILCILKDVRQKVKEDGKRYYDESNYDKARELVDWSEKFDKIDFDIIEEGFNNEDTYDKDVETNTSADNGIKLSLNDVWTSYFPISFAIDGKKEKIFGNWKDLFVGVLRELCRRNYKKFEKMVNDNVVKGKKYQIFATKKLDENYSSIHTTGYYYRSFGLSPEQMRVYLQRIFEYFEMNTERLQVFVDPNRRRKLNGISQSKESVTEKIMDDTVYIIDKTKRCPICYSVLESMHKEYLLYNDESKGGEPKREKTYVKKCSSCDKEFITKDTYLTLQKQKINFENRVNFKTIKL